MKKDVIYVDIEDDITSIIEKVKGAQAKIVALVPPKRIGVLQSVVNLKLLQRAAEGVNKRVVLITNDASLTSLAAGVAIPVAKNLQSKPEIAPITTLEVDDEDIINGEELPIGELAATAPMATAVSNATPTATSSAPTPAVPAAALAAASAPKKGPSIPNFDTMRKKIFLFGGIGVLLLAFLIWAIFFASKAVVSITARTTPYSVNKVLSLSPGATLDSKTGSLASVVKEQQKTATVDFTPTGKKEVGEKATGSLSLRNNKISPVSVPAGTIFEADDLEFTSNSAVTVPAASLCAGPGGGAAICEGTATVAITASAIGPEYNIEPQSYSTDANVSASASAATAGGTKKEVTVVSVDDIAKAKEKLAAQDANAIKNELKKEFEKTIVVIDESFIVTPAEPVSSPAVDQEATTAKLTAETKYSMVGVARNDLDKILKDDITIQLEGLPNQKIYDSGVNKVRFTGYQPGENGASSVRLVATGYVGPNIDSDKLAKEIEGKRAGEIQAHVQSIDGVESVQANLSPFWVNTAPKADKITIKFLVKNETN